MSRAALNVALLITPAMKTPQMPSASRCAVGMPSEHLQCAAEDFSAMRFANSILHRQKLSHVNRELLILQVAQGAWRL